MHVISDERALAHWAALCRLPALAADVLRSRFIREQPGLAAWVLALTGGTVEGPDGMPRIRSEDDPKLAVFWRLATESERLAEVFRREAGRPLRELEAAEISELTKANLALFEKFRNVDDDRPASAPDLFTSCSQPNLYGVVVTAVTNGERMRPEELTLECYLLRAVVEGLHRACSGESAPDAKAWDAERIVVALSSQGDPLRREALAASEAFGAELAPRLIEELESWVDDPEAALTEDGSLGTHGLFLLARWRENSAWPVLRRLFSLPGKRAYDLLGDLITEDGSIVLAMAAGGRRNELQAMIEDEHLDEYCRYACLDALTCHVAWGEWPRQELVAYLRDLLTSRLRGVPENEHIFAGAVSAACDLEAWELRPEIEAAYERGVVDEAFIDLGYFLKSQARKHPNQWQEFCARHAQIEDVAAATKWLDNPPEPEPPVTPEEERRFVESAQPYLAPPKVGRNEPCPCGSGKKYKKCCGG